VVDHEGHLVGLNTHRVEDGFYVAIPAAGDLRTFVEQAASGDLPNRRSLGIAVLPPAAARRLRAAVGLPLIDAPLVRGVVESSPAAQAGIRRGDLIVRANDEPIASVDDLHRALDAASSTIRLGIVRGSEEIEVLVDFDDVNTAAGGEA
jgi:S1-C subfamily serine protease